MAIETWRDWLHADSITATQQDSDWPASHLDLVDFERAWHATGTGSVAVAFNFDSPVRIRCLHVQRPNWPECQVQHGSSNTLIDTMTTTTDGAGIRRAFLAFDVTTDKLRMSIPSDTSLDGLGYWHAGTARLMGTYEQLDVPGFLTPFTDVAVDPGEVTTLPHGGREQTLLGPTRVRWEAQIRRPDSVDIRKLRRLARAQDVIIRPWDDDSVTIPMRNWELERARTFDRAVRHSESPIFEEV